MKPSVQPFFSLMLTASLLSLTTVPWADNVPSRFEIMPFGGYRLSGSMALNDPSYSRLDFGDGGIYGLAAGINLGEDVENGGSGALEFMWTHQDSSLKAVPNPGITGESVNMKVDQFHINGLYFPPGFPRAMPYAIAGLGATHFAPSGDNSLTRFSWGLGGGVKTPLTRRLGLRLEAKWDPALAQSTGGVFCNSATGRCFVSASGDLLNQFDFTAGLTLGF